MSNFTKLHLTHEIFRILPVFSQFLWNLAFIFSDAHEKDFWCYYRRYYIFTGVLIIRTVADPRNSGISAKSPAKFPKNTKYREICQKYFQIHVGKTHLILILAIRAVLVTSNVQIFLETSSRTATTKQRLKTTRRLRWTLWKTGH